MNNNPLDNKLDKQLKAGFDAQKHQAPAHLWDKISEELAADTSLENKLESLREDTPIVAAPIGLWNTISKDLDTDQLIDGKVADAIETQPLKVAPISIWKGIQRQLNIDATWVKIANELPHVAPKSKWRKRTAQITAAAMLLLLLRTCTGEPTLPIQNTATLAEETTTINTKSSNDQATTSIAEGKKTITKEKLESASTKEQQAATKKNTIVAKEQATLDNNTKESPQPLANNRYEKTGNTVESSLIGVSKKESENNLKNNSKKIQPLPTSTTIAASLEQETVDRQANIVTNNILQPIENSNNETIAPSKTYNWLDGVALLPLVTAIQATEKAILLETEIETSDKKSPLEDKLKVGVFVVVNSTTIVNEDTREGWKGSDRIQNNANLAANYGLWASYQFLPKSSLVAEFSINADNRQGYRVTEGGINYDKEWVLKYQRVSLAYQHQLWQAKGTQVINTITAQGGLYVGFLQQAKLFYDGELFFDALQEHRQFDVGFKLAIGQELQFGNMLIGYGLRSDIGAANVFRGNSMVLPQENKTSLLHLGGYVTVGYKF